jgi:GT2 family glycosyltransferase
MQNKFAIGIPTINRLDLLHPALLFYLRDFPTTKIYVVDNGKQNISAKIKHPNIIVIENEKNMGVASSWNKLCDLIYKENDYAIILNDDIYWGKKDWEIDNLLSNYNKDLYNTTQDWCVFILPKKTYEEVGLFDVRFFPAYYEDNDYAYRIIFFFLSLFKIPFLNPFVYQSSQTTQKHTHTNRTRKHNTHNANTNTHIPSIHKQ